MSKIKLLPKEPVARFTVIVLIISFLYSITAYIFDTIPIEIGIGTFIPAAILFFGQSQIMIAELRSELLQTRSDLTNKTDQILNLLNDWRSNQKAIVIEDVKDDDRWRHISGDVYMYNALWTLSEDRFRDTFSYLLSKKRTPWKVVYFNGRTAEQKRKAELRERRMWTAIKGIILTNSDIETLIEISKSKEKNLPDFTFFLFEHDGRKVSRIYLDKLLKAEQPEIAFDIYDDTIYKLLKDEFELHFHNGERQSLN